MKRAPSAVSHPPEEPGPKSGHLLSDPSQGQMDQIQWATPTGGFHVEMLRIPHIHWWKVLIPCGRRTMFSHILCESLNELEALCLAHWQVVIFQLPQVQQGAVGWWTPPLAISGLHLEDYMPSPASSNFWIMRQQKTMALARALQACTEEAGFPTGVLCDVAWELQWYMAPLFVLNGNEIVEATLLRSIEEEHRTSPTPEAEAALLGDIKFETKPEIKHKVEPPSPRAIEDPWAGTDCRANCHSYSLPLIPSFPTKSPPFLEGKILQERATRVEAIITTQWVQDYLKKAIGCPNGGESFSPYSRPLWLCNPKTGPPTGCSLLDTCHTATEG